MYKANMLGISHVKHTHTCTHTYIYHGGPMASICLNTFLQ